MKCTLSKDINNCPFCDKEKMECKNKVRCAFQINDNEDVKVKDRYTRKERWYEKYYK